MAVRTPSAGEQGVTGTLPIPAPDHPDEALTAGRVADTLLPARLAGSVMAKRDKPARQLVSAGRSRGKLTLPGRLLDDVRALIRQAREGVALAVNAALVLTYWEVGHRIRTEVLKEKRAEYSEQIVPKLSTQLVPEFGRGFAEKSLRRMIQFAEVFPDRQIVAALSRQLGWSHFVEIIPLKDDLQRDFYAEMCRVEHWSVRTLRVQSPGLVVRAVQAAHDGRQPAFQVLAQGGRAVGLPGEQVAALLRVGGQVVQLPRDRGGLPVLDPV